MIKEDAEENVSDTYMAAWRAIPPRRPSVLSVFLGKITRHISIDRWRERSAQKRGGGEVVFALEELKDCVAGMQDVEMEYERKVIVKAYLKFFLPSKYLVTKDRLWGKKLKLTVCLALQQIMILLGQIRAPTKYSIFIPRM